MIFTDAQAEVPSYFVIHGYLNKILSLWSGNLLKMHKDLIAKDLKP